jgi:EAL domain-containing protein (putative c-di-GMP-specific phosphodiesterase class I)
VEAKTNLISGFEALIRWDHPERGPISPGIFIPIAEEANLIGDLGEWALRQACTDAASWVGVARVAVNVSAVQVAREGLPAIVASALRNSGLAPERLALEITESVFIGESADTDATFATLKKLGVRLALDDFGTGYSSLGYLKSAPFDKIKIDQSFVSDATKSGNRNSALIAAIVSLADALDMETTAEGVETLDTLDLIRKLNVSHVQGYVYSRPLPNVGIAERLARGDLEIKPSGPKSNRSDRKTLFRKAGVIHEDHRYEVTMRNLSKTGALIEGLLDVPLGTEFVLDFGEGQLAVSTVVRSKENCQGLTFEVPLISDGSDGLCTRHRISPYSLAAAGMPLAALPAGQYPLTQNGQIQDLSQSKFSLPAFRLTDGSDGSRRVA